MTPEDILEAAQIIRPYLPDLLGPDAETVDRTLTPLITRAAAGEPVENEILALLAEQDATREWSRQFLQDKMPPPVMRGIYEPLPGTTSQITANKFICPEANCDYVWYSPRKGINPPKCPQHHVTLVPAPANTP